MASLGSDFRPPACEWRFTSMARLPALLDTVIVEPTARRFSVVWRASLTCDKKARRVSHVALSCRSAV